MDYQALSKCAHCGEPRNSHGPELRCASGKSFSDATLDLVVVAQTPQVLTVQTEVGVRHVDHHNTHKDKPVVSLSGRFVRGGFQVYDVNYQDGTHSDYLGTFVELRETQ